MMYEINKHTLFIDERPNANLLSAHFVMVGKFRRGRDTIDTYYAETLEEAQAMAAKMRAESVAKKLVVWQHFFESKNQNV